MDYISYFHFFEILKQIIHDVQLDFNESKYIGGEYDREYNLFIHRLTGYCQKYSSSIFHPTKDAFLSAYVKAMCDIREYPQEERFHRLLSLTDEYLRKSA